MSNDDRVTCEYVRDFGVAATVFSTLSMQYSVFTSTVAGGNQFATAALKLTIFNPVCTLGDCFGQLVFEPYWNQPGQPAGSSALPPKDVWETYSIDFNTGFFWWTGGFGEASGAGGPPL